MIFLIFVIFLQFIKNLTLFSSLQDIFSNIKNLSFNNHFKTSRLHHKWMQFAYLIKGFQNIKINYILDHPIKIYQTGFFTFTGLLSTIILCTVFSVRLNTIH